MLNNGLRWSWIAIVVFGLDRVTKEMAQKYLLPYVEQAVVPGFNLTLSYNKGAAFSFLQNASGWQVWFFGIIAFMVSVAIFISLFRLSWRQYGTAIAFCLIMGGALGNLADRVFYGQVIDFIQLYVAHFYWPTFNIADSMICLGAAILFGQTFRATNKG